ncbi:hypothetical protein Lal_00036032 [Lupinus albus]|uniref:Putative F-box domain, FBD domain, leucine-rich repeat domain, L domain-containing protein n=1 Tax=Lupinus albus TaxID=3870 RepID=A0A6A5M1Q6_LUPAL|nr:putative F-box domain, FBD domain, leucine-rich repeat domain, L domain-containing protein [Lupinus albus]KAF1868594.1 hypothetical protein Lal_00036032 [Lupinus albus]
MAVSLDMLSLLPDPLLIIIISLLPFKEAIRTSVFSKSWCNNKLFKLTTNIEFNELFFVKSYQPSIKHLQRKAFLDFITFWIDNNKESIIEKFSLKLSMPNNVSELTEKCIAFATHKGGVKHLELDFSDPKWVEYNNVAPYHKFHEPMFALPKHVYDELKGIQILKLYSCRFVEKDLLNFHALKEVSFGWMEVSIFLINSLISNCKMLESLSLKRCWNFSEFYLRDRNQKLKKLVVDNCSFQYELFRVVAPNLKFFKYSGMMSYFDIKGCPQVEVADLDFSTEFGFGGKGYRLYNFMEDFYSLKVLTVCSYFLQVIPHGSDMLRMERNFNIRHLTIKTQLNKSDYRGIVFMLRSCPMLQCLTIQLGCARIWPNYAQPFASAPKNFWTENVRIYECLKSSLEVLEVKGFQGFDKSEIRMLAYFIQSGKVLKKMTINMEKDIILSCNRNLDLNPRKFAEFLLKVPRASTDLEITIC